MQSPTNSPLNVTDLSYSLLEVTSPASMTAQPASSTAPSTATISTALLNTKRRREETVELIEEILVKRLKEHDDASYLALSTKLEDQSTIIEMQSNRILDLELHNSALQEEVDTLWSDLEELRGSMEIMETSVRCLRADLDSFWWSCRETFPDF